MKELPNGKHSMGDLHTVVMCNLPQNIGIIVGESGKAENIFGTNIVDYVRTSQYRMYDDCEVYCILPMNNNTIKIIVGESQEMKDNKILDKYAFLTPTELAKIVFNKDRIFEGTIDFTFDTKEDVLSMGEPSGWNGIAKSAIFDETHGTITIGYFGGGSTISHELINDIDDIDDDDIVIREIETCIRNYARDWYGSNHLDVLCVAKSSLDKDK